MDGLDFLLFFSGLFALLQGVGALVGRGLNSRALLACALYTVAGIVVAKLGFFVSGLLRIHPELFAVNLLHLPALYATGPLLWMYVRQLQGRPPAGRGAYLQLIPAALAFVGVVLIHARLLSAPGTNYFSAPVDVETIQNHHRLLYDLAALPLAAYGLFFFYDLRTVWSSRSFRREPLTIHLLLISILLATLMLVSALAQVRGDFALLKATVACASSGALIWLYLLGLRYPDADGLLQKELRTRRYEKSNLARVDATKSLAELERLMREERLYLDEDLAPDDLCRRLGLSNHQLSELLSTGPGLSYYQYVNAFRIEHACETLLREPERTVLTVALDSGFNSKSSFHAAFARVTGMTPSAYRRRYAPPGRA
jgi:AraC-like DNA-binding protein